MRTWLFWLSAAGILSLVFWSQLQLGGRLIRDNDESIYLTTLLLIVKGFSAYRNTFVSQPPFFILAVYPIFHLLGNTIAAARIVVGIWSLAGLAAVFWLTAEMKKKEAGLLAAGFLLLIPHFTQQMVTLQSDAIASACSLLALAAFIRFTVSRKLVWYAACSLFLNMAFWTKFDVTLVPSLILGVYLYHKKSGLRLGLLFLVVSTLFLTAAILPFGLGAVWDNVVTLRLQAAQTTPFTFQFFNYIGTDPALMLLLALGFIYLFLNRSSLKQTEGTIALWVVATLITLITYRPLFSHHLTLLAVPVSLWCGLSIYNSLERHRIFLILVTFSVSLLAAISLLLFVSRHRSSTFLSESEISAVACIRNNTNSNDTVVSDNEILNAASGRLPPPPLSDVSYIRITSGNLTPEYFSAMLRIYRPKMVIAWNGRLLALRHFDQLLKEYTEISCGVTSKGKRVYVRN